MAQQQQQEVRRVLKVAPPGKGDGECFPTVQAAVDAVPLGNRARVVIRLAPGVYREPVHVAKTKNFITIAGASPEATVVSWDNTATRIKHSQVRGSGGGVCSLSPPACVLLDEMPGRLVTCVRVLRSL
jgi:pectinesterase